MIDLIWFDNDDHDMYGMIHNDNKDMIVRILKVVPSLLSQFSQASFELASEILPQLKSNFLNTLWLRLSQKCEITKPFHYDLGWWVSSESQTCTCLEHLLIQQVSIKLDASLLNSIIFQDDKGYHDGNDIMMIIWV